MLALPTVGFAKSVDAHNIDLDTLCDWIEGSILFDDDELSVSDVVDVLRENELYAKQDKAREFVSVAWTEMKRRIGWLGAGCPVVFNGARLRRHIDWPDAPGHAFCLCLSYAKHHPKWAKGFGQNFTKQGELFERLTVESLVAHFPKWTVHPTGWTAGHSMKLGEVVDEVVDLLGERVGELHPWASESANEAGLDILCFRSFEDSRYCSPVLLVQCASGKYHDGKLRTPDLRVWTKIVKFTSDPNKAFSTPYGLGDDEFKRVSNIVNGVLLDRYRLLAPTRTKSDWVSSQLAGDIVAWTTPRMKKLPRLNS